ncbi:dTMP kinase [Kushneria konosiri]|uniref:Thymidylate kinase n=1 Tax=Kushneria konosiri TaxID=698828 RepID=A0A2Z2H8P2_9GAMM|nr:dTMP kinase [Kushneria konosiri]ARS53843.1 dTMP kinase [Kushneria konosiri]
MTQQGRFITLEGGEGVGKSTNLSFVRDYLHSRGIRVVTTREPGGTPVAERIRALLLANDEQEPLDDLAELLLVFAGRAHHLARVIRPALDRGEWVISDRFTDATFAYQGSARGIAPERIAMLEQFVQQGLAPDLTLWLDMPTSYASARLSSRGGERDRFERERGDFFERVRQGYRARAEQDPGRIVAVDAAQPLEQVQRDIALRLDQQLSSWN